MHTLCDMKFVFREISKNFGGMQVLKLYSFLLLVVDQFLSLLLYLKII